MSAFHAKADGIEHKDLKADQKDDVVDEAEQNDPQEGSGGKENNHEGNADGDRYPPLNGVIGAITAFHKENVHEDNGGKENGDGDARGKKEVPPLTLIASIEEEDTSPEKP